MFSISKSKKIGSSHFSRSPKKKVIDTRKLAAPSWPIHKTKAISLRPHFFTQKKTFSSSKASEPLVFYVNKQKHSIPSGKVDPASPLIDYLRENGKEQIMSPKLTCGEGGCGACTVALGKFDQGKVEYRTVNSCLYPVAAAHHTHIVTSEGLGTAKNPHPLQERFASFGASQCGFCSPGFIMSLWTTLKTRGSEVKEKELLKSIDGNLCRCTGYRPILDVVKSYASDAEFQPRFGRTVEKVDFSNSDPPFPTELMTPMKSMEYSGSYGYWRSPTTSEELLALKEQAPSAKISNGFTEIGIETRFKSQYYPFHIFPSYIDAYTQVTIADDTLRIGAAASLTSLQKSLSEKKDGFDENAQQIFQAILDQLYWFAGTPIRNAASVGGNIINASPISDLIPVFLATRANFVVESRSTGKRTIPANDFFLGYKRVDLAPDEVLAHIEIPLTLTPKRQFTEAYKQARRREDDIAIVTGCFSTSLDSDNVIINFRAGLGGIAPVPRIAKDLESFLVGKKFEMETFQEAARVFFREIALPDNTPGGMERYRESLCLGFFFKYWCTVLKQIDGGAVPDKWMSAIQKLPKTTTTQSTHHFDIPERGSAVGKPSTPIHSLKQVTGEALYTTDIPTQNREVQGWLVQSAIPAGKVRALRPEKALELPGVFGFYTAKDLPGNNMWGDIVADEEFLVDKEILHHGQPIGIIVAENSRIAQQAAKMVEIEYEEAKPILSIKDAIKNESFFPTVPTLSTGDTEKALQNSKFVVEGAIDIGGQEHFYFEPMSALAVPHDADQMTVHTSTQNGHKTQYFVASGLGMKANQVVSKTVRIGGGFGGKETRSIPYALHAALAASKLNQPVRLNLPRDVDMSISGLRHPFRGEYKIGVDSDGKILGGNINLYANGGHSHDLSYPVLSRAILFADGAYHVPSISIVGKVCKTNLPSNTAFRGFGGPQGAILSEMWIEHIASVLKKRPEDVRELNLQKEGQNTFYGQPIPRSLFKSWETCKQSSDFEKRYQEVQEFNQKNRFRKRGIALVPTKYGCAFNFYALNQGGALIHIYQDGTVLVTHGGVEMGQGLNTKVAQVVANELDIPLENVTVHEMATDKVANAPPTAGSMGTDIFAGAAQNAALKLAERLKPLRDQNPSLSFTELTKKAWLDRIDLSAHGFFKSEHEGYDMVKNEGKPWRYFTLGTACTEVEIDCLTGDHKVLRTDLVVDVGQPINPLVDIGQIEGAFTQGQGWGTIEEVMWADDDHSWAKPNGRVLSVGPGIYKIPSLDDIPTDWRLTILSAKQPDPTEIQAVHSSKAVGEPPLLLGISVPMAIKEAIKAARSDEGENDYFPLHTPVTAEKIRMACLDPILKSIQVPVEFQTKRSI